MTHMKVASLSAALAGATVHLVEHAALQAKDLATAIEREDFYALVLASPDDVATVLENYGRKLVELANGIRAANELPVLARHLLPLVDRGVPGVSTKTSDGPTTADWFRTNSIIAQAAEAISTMNATHGLTPPATEDTQ